jgi:hypothetical protein
MNEFARAYHDFTHHYVEIDDEKMSTYSQEVEKFWSEVEKKAEELEVTCDYYIQEFM